LGTVVSNEILINAVYKAYKFFIGLIKVFLIDGLKNTNISS